MRESYVPCRAELAVEMATKYRRRYPAAYRAQSPAAARLSGLRRDRKVFEKAGFLRRKRTQERTYISARKRKKSLAVSEPGVRSMVKLIYRDNSRLYPFPRSGRTNQGCFSRNGLVILLSKLKPVRTFLNGKGRPNPLFRSN